VSEASRFVPEGERVLLRLKPHPLFILLVPLGIIAGSLVLAGVGVWALSALGGRASARIVWLGVVALVALRLLWQALEWWARDYTLTDRRVLRVGGVLRRYVTDIPLSRLQHVTVFQTIRERVFGLGTVGFATAGTGVVEAYWVMVARPRAIVQRVREAAGAPPSDRATAPILTIGLSGAIGAGKSTVAAALADLGCVVSDSDRLAKEALDRDDVRRRLVEWWGEGVLGEDGRVDRRALADIVFADEGRRRRLEGLTHPIVHELREAARERARAAGARALVIDAPLLFEAGVDRECDAIIFVDAPEDRRRAWLRERRGWTDQEIDRRAGAQMPLKDKRARSDHVLVNDADEATLRRRAGELLARIERDRRPAS
jgi:dephospho-CoA kinase